MPCKFHLILHVGYMKRENSLLYITKTVRKSLDVRSMLLIATLAVDCPVICSMWIEVLAPAIDVCNSVRWCKRLMRMMKKWLNSTAPMKETSMNKPNRPQLPICIQLCISRCEFAKIGFQFERIKTSSERMFLFHSIWNLTNNCLITNAQNRRWQLTIWLI